MRFVAPSTAMSSKDFYDKKYSEEREYEAEWLRRGASAKADSIELLLKRHSLKPNILLELGCGTGAVVGECQKRGLAREFKAIDSSKAAIDYLKRHSPNIDSFEADITDPSFRLQDRFDIVVLSHVLEHLDKPLDFLQCSLRRLNFDHIVIEVPLENLSVSRARNVFRDRYQNAAGHVQFFTPRTFKTLLRQAGLKIIDERIYAPVLSLETIAFLRASSAMSPSHYYAKILVGHYLPRLAQRLWKRYYYAHHAVLCSFED